MPAPITNSPFVPPTLAPLASPAAEPAAGIGFGEMLQAAVQRAGGMQQQADAQVMYALAGGDVTQVEVMTSVKKADLALRMMLQVRNKLLDAYNEIQQMRF